MHSRAAERHRPAMPLVLVHGVAVSHRYLMPLAAELSPHHPVHVVDLPGFGLSTKPPKALDVARCVRRPPSGTGFVTGSSRSCVP
jgi:pimeloyl-ACP methyl ester carboxylesterase